MALFTQKYKELNEKGLIEWRKDEIEEKVLWKPHLKFYLEGRLKQPSNLWTKIEGNKKHRLMLEIYLEIKF